ncbi:reverse transcriptase domain-containing protein, partial [Tanacetum coccineum]
IETILNHLDELPLERIEHMENKIEGLGNGRREQIRHDDEIVLARVRTSTLEILIEDIQAGQPSGKLVVDNVADSSEYKLLRWQMLKIPIGTPDKVRKALLASSAGLNELNQYFSAPIGIEEAYKITWSEFKKLLIKKYCPRTEVKKMEDEFYNLTVKGNDLKTYVRRFQELVVLCPTMVPNSEKLIEVFIRGLPKSIEGNVTASKPQTLRNPLP